MPEDYERVEFEEIKANYFAEQRNKNSGKTTT